MSVLGAQHRDRSRRPGQEGRLEHRRVPARARHARGLARARRAAGQAVLGRPERAPRARSERRAHGRDPAGVHRHDDRRLAPRAAGRDGQARARRARARHLREIELGLSEAEARRGAELCLDCYCPANGTLRPAALRHRVRGLQEQVPRAGRPRLPGRLSPRLHHARAQPLHQLPALRARLPHGGRGELLRRHGPRLGHDRLHARQPAAADHRLRLVRQVRRDVSDRRPSRPTRASCRATT